MKTRTLISVLLVFALVVWLAPLGCAKRSVQAQGAPSSKPEGNKITVTGKIVYMKAYGGYCVQGEVPARMFFVVNEDPKILEELKTSGKTVTIEGQRTMGADHLFIEKIDGQRYQGAKEPPSK